MERRVATTRGIEYDTFFVEEFSKIATPIYSERFLVSIEMVFRKENCFSRGDQEKNEFKNLIYQKKL